MRALLLAVVLPAVWCDAPARAGEEAASAQELLKRGVVLGRSGQLDPAERLLLEGRRRFPADARFQQELAGIAFRRSDLPAARRYLRQALGINPADPYANDFLGSLYLLDGNLPAALKYWNRIQKPWLGSVLFDPPPPLAPLLRERNFEVSAGQVFTYDRLLRTESRLDLLGIFADCRFSLAPRAGTGYDLTVQTVPLAPPLRGWPGQVLSALSGLPYQEVRPEFNNIGQRAINISSLWRWDAQKRRVAVAISGPLHFWRYNVVFDARQENWDLRGATFGLRRVEAGAGLARDLGSRLIWAFGLWATARQFRAATGSFFSSGWTGELRNRLDYRLWDWPDRRVRVDTWGVLRTGSILAANPSRLVSIESGWRGRWIPQAKGERYIVRADSRGGAIIGNAPLDELFMLGMERDNDLWLRGHVGTRDGRKGNAPMGRQYFMNRIGLGRRLVQLPAVRLEAGPFFDTGRIGDGGQFGSRGWLYDTGIQVRVGAPGGMQFLAVYGRSLRDGTGVFYTGIRR
ncbi:MAG: tetratricopeptide repeat protein [Acidobacteria bacterium]|nr:tetratricopeptide repeat protein [Acidobacteriota bacterium]